MTHEIKYQEKENHCFEVEVLYDHDSDGEKETIWEGDVSLSKWQVQDGNLEDRMRQIAENRIQEYEEEPDDRDKKSGTVNLK